MSTTTEPAWASRNYEEAHAIHYQERDLLRALGAYCRIIASSPGTPEADHSRTQIRNIVNRAVPADELLSAETELALRHLQADDETTAHHERDRSHVDPRGAPPLRHHASAPSAEAETERRDDRGSHQGRASRRRQSMTTQTVGFLWVTALGVALIPGLIAMFLTARQSMMASVQPSGTSSARPAPASRWSLS